MAADSGRDLAEAAAAVLGVVARPSIGVVLGSGLGGFAAELEASTRIPFAEIAHMPSPTVAGHAGALHVGTLGAVRVACLQGRVHAYEGHPTSRVVFGVRLLVELGCSVVLLSNAAGGIRDDLDPGSLMLIEDHLNLTGINPLSGENPSFGPRFVDLRDAYDPELCALARRAALAAGIPLRSGVYAAMAGPSYETPAEIRMLRTLGADAVGMSTVLEVIALRHRDARVAAVSCITNRAAGLPGAILDHRDVERVAEESSGRFSTLFREWIALIGKVTA